MLRPPSPEPGPPATAAEAGPTEDPRAGLGPELRVDVARSGAVMAAGTLVSRILGFARAALLAAAIGLQSHSGDAFQVANTVPNIVYMLLAGSVLNAVLVPAITRAARQGAKGRIFVDRLVTVSVAVMFGATVIVTVAAPIVVDLYTSRKVPAEQIALSVAFAYWCLPQVLFYGLYMVWGQVLNARGAFAAYTWAPVVNNVVAITGLVVYVVKYGAGAKPLDSWTPAGIALLAGTATLGVVAQAVILLPVMRRSGYVWRPRWGIRGVGLRTASTMAAWTFAAVVLTQVAYAVTSRVLTAAGDASLAAGGPIRTSLQIYSNAFLIYMLPHSIITVSLVTALFTRMSDAAGRGDTRAVRDDLSLGLRLTLLVTLPSTTFMLLMGPHVTAVLFPHNKAPETRGIALGAAAMMAGLAAYSAQYLVHRVFYAFEDARTPFYAQAPGVVLSVPLALAAGAFLPPGWVVVGIGLTISLSNLLGLALAAYLLRARLHSLDGARVTRVGVRVFLAAVVSAAACWGAALLAEPAVTALAGAGFLTEVVTLLVGVAVMAVVYWFALRALRVRELDELVRPILARVRRTTPAS